MLSRHAAGEDLSAELWPLVVLELWHSQLCAPANRRAETADVLPPPVVVEEENLYAAS
jgi:hypothetical protein